MTQGTFLNANSSLSYFCDSGQLEKETRVKICVYILHMHTHTCKAGKAVIPEALTDASP